MQNLSKNIETFNKLKLLLNILFIEFKDNCIKYNNTELYHDIHRAIIEKTYTDTLLRRANDYWNLYENIDVDTFIFMMKQVDIQADKNDDTWYYSIYKLLKKSYDDKIPLLTRPLLKFHIIKMLFKKKS